ncbi:MAG: nucleotide exchange factor GrpE [Christensenellales bacterium]|jgi:molecular chaperone GrpE
MANRKKRDPQDVLKDQAEEVTVETAAEEVQPTADEWKEALEKTVRQRDEYLSMAQRTQAEFMNFKKRNQQVYADAYDEGVREVLTKMLPTIDNLERAIDAAEKHDAEDALLEGVRMTLKSMLDAAGKLGMEEVPALGEKFDPEKHNAVLSVAEGEPGTILEVFQKGYRAKDKIIRYAMVKVAVE